MKSRASSPAVPSACKASSLPRTCNAMFGCTRSPCPRSHAHRRRNVRGGRKRAPPAHTNPPCRRRATSNAYNPYHIGFLLRIALAGRGHEATRNLAFHARLIELALQAGNTTGCILKNIRWRAVDVNRPVTPSCPLAAALAAAIMRRYRGIDIHCSPAAPFSANTACKARSTSPG
jgi:hypothetical protein